MKDVKSTIPPTTIQPDLPHRIIKFLNCQLHDNHYTNILNFNLCDDIVFGFNDFYDCPDSTGIYAGGCKRMLAFECNFTNFGTGIYTVGSENVEIEASLFQDNNYQGAEFESSDIVCVSGCQFLDNNRGLWLETSDKIYVSKSGFHDNFYQGVYMDESSMILVSNNFTGNIEGVYGYHSQLMAQYNSFYNNTDSGLSCNAFSVFNATDNWWGDSTGPYHWSMNPLGAGDQVSDNVSFDPWQTQLYQPDTLISDMRCQLQNDYWSIIYPDEKTPKPLGCVAASVSDWLASNYISTKIREYEEALDTDNRYVNQTTGEPMGEPGTMILTFGGPFVNPIVKRAEDGSTLAEDRAPVKFYNGGDTFYYQYSNGTNIPGAELPVSKINKDEDLFIIERYLDSEGKIITICYGFGWKGTYAAGKYFEEEIYPKLGTYTSSWIVIHWEETNGDGFVNEPGSGDTYTVIARGS
jgi:hypothetical protein